MNEVLIKKLIEAFSAMITLNESLIVELKKALGETPAEEPKKRGRKKGEDAPPVDLSTVVFEHACGCKVTNDRATSAYCAEHKKNIDLADAAKALAASGGATAQNPIVPIQKEQPEPTPAGALLSGDVTIELLRAKSVEFTDPKNGFGMEAWLELAQKVTGKKAVKDIPKEMYGAFYGTMDVELAKKRGIVVGIDPAKTDAPAAVAPAVEKKPEPVKAAPAASPVTLDVIKPAAKAFMDKMGQPMLLSVLKVFGAVKLSEVDPAKYPALLEALSNA